MRGIVLGSCAEVTSGFFISQPGASRLGPPQGAMHTMYPERIDPAIRRNLLYFDVVDFPKPVAMPSAPNCAVLVEQGFLQHTPLDMSEESLSRDAGDPYGALHRYAFEQCEARDPGAWSFAPLVRTPGWAQKLHPTQPDIVESRGIEFQLYNALPVPRADTEYVDILEFKARREDELLALRGHMDGLYAEIVRSADIPRAKIAALYQLDKSIADVIAVMNASRLPFDLKRISIDLGLQIVGDFTAAEWVADKFHSEHAAAFGIAAASYRFVKTVFRSPVKREGPLIYIDSALREQVVGRGQRLRT